MANFRQVKSILTSKMGQGPTKASLHITVDGSTEVEMFFIKYFHQILLQI